MQVVLLSDPCSKPEDGPAAACLFLHDWQVSVQPGLISDAESFCHLVYHGITQVSKSGSLVTSLSTNPAQSLTIYCCVMGSMSWLQVGYAEILRPGQQILLSHVTLLRQEDSSAPGQCTCQFEVCPCRSISF